MVTVFVVTVFVVTVLIGASRGVEGPAERGQREAGLLEVSALLQPESRPQIWV
ncbi:MAG: hypothetical protein ABIP03_10550 [Aquihabitans sp.]